MMHFCHRCFLLGEQMPLILGNYRISTLRCPSTVFSSHSYLLQIIYSQFLVVVGTEEGLMTILLVVEMHLP